MAGTILDKLTLVIDTEIDTKELEKLQKKAEKAAAKAEKELKKAAKESEKAFDKFASSTKTKLLVVAAAAAAIGAAFTKAVVEVTAFGREIDRTAKAIGVSTDEFQRLRFAQEQSGLSGASLEKGLRQFNVFLGDALTKNTGSLIDALKMLNTEITAQDFAALSTTERIKLFGEAMKSTDDSTQAAAAAAKAFGTEAGTDLVPLLMKSNKEIDELLSQAEKIGAVLSKEAIAKTTEFDNALKAITQVLKVTAAEIGVELLPLAKEMIGTISDWSRENKGLWKSQLREFIQKAVKLTKELLPIILDLTTAFVDFVNKTEVLTSSVDKLTSALEGFRTVNDVVKEGVKDIAGYFGVADDKVQSLIDNVPSLTEIMADMYNAMLQMTSGGLIGENAGERALRKQREQANSAAVGVGGGFSESAKAIRSANAKGSRRASSYGTGPQLTDVEVLRMREREEERLRKEREKRLRGRKKEDPYAEDLAAVIKEFGEIMEKGRLATGTSQRTLELAFQEMAKARNAGFVPSEVEKRGDEFLSTHGGFKKDFLTRKKEWDRDMSEFDPRLSGNLQDIARGAHPQVLVSNIYNTFNFDNDFQISGADSPAAVGQATVEAFKTHFKREVEAATDVVKIPYVR